MYLDSQISAPVFIWLESMILPVSLSFHMLDVFYSSMGRCVSDLLRKLKTDFLIRRLFNPFMTNGLSHPYHSDESTFILRVTRYNFFFFFDEIM